MDPRRFYSVEQAREILFTLPDDGAESDDPDFSGDEGDEDREQNNNQGILSSDACSSCGGGGVDVGASSSRRYSSNRGQSVRGRGRLLRGRVRGRGRGRGLGQRPRYTEVESSSDSEDLEVPDIGGGGDAVMAEVSDIQLDEVFDCEYPQFQPDYQPGPTHLLPATATPIDFWDLLFPSSLMETIVEETNRYAQQQKTKGWTETTEEEVRAFFGMLTALGLHGLPSMTDIWSMDWIFGIPALAKFMTKNRFLQLWGNLHLVDNQAYLAAHPRGSEGYDRLFKLRPALSALPISFKKNYQLTQNICVDEAMVKGKGKNPVQQYLPMKPIKRGTKIWCLADSSSGYLYDFQVYAGKQGKIGEAGLGGRVVMDLVTDLSEHNHVLYIDNFFTSVPLARQLEELGIFTCGTIRSNRSGFPAQLKEPALIKAMKERGSLHSARVTPNKKLSAVTWQDTKLVSFLTNVCPPQGDTTILRKGKDGSKQQVPCPPCVPLYNQNMGAVDRSDAAVRPYAVDRKCRRWWVRPFLSLALDRVRVNAYILYKENLRKWPVTFRSLSHKDFISQLAKELLGTFCSRKAPGPKVNPLYTLPLVRERGHESINVVSAGLLKRGRCSFCCLRGGPYQRKETRSGCGKCLVRLCHEKCHDAFHKKLQND